MQYETNESFALRTGYRLLKGVQNNDDVYTFSLFHYILAEAVWSFQGIVVLMPTRPRALESRILSRAMRVPMPSVVPIDQETLLFSIAKIRRVDTCIS